MVTTPAFRLVGNLPLISERGGGSKERCGSQKVAKNKIVIYKGGPFANLRAFLDHKTTTYDLKAIHSLSGLKTSSTILRKMLLGP